MTDTVIDDMSPAVVRALGKLTDVVRSREVNAGPYRYRYADLGDILSQVRPILAAEDLAVTQHVTHNPTDHTVTVRTVLLHKSGESMPFDALTLPASGSVQQIGSSITYARRYSLMASLGLATEDDDGASANTAPPPPPSTAHALGWPDEATQRQTFDELRDRTNYFDADPVKQWAKEQGITSRGLTTEQAQEWAAKLSSYVTVADQDDIDPPARSLLEDGP